MRQPRDFATRRDPSPRSSTGRRVRAVPRFAAIAALLCAGCAHRGYLLPSPRPGEDPFDRVTVLTNQSGAKARVTQALPPSYHFLHVPAARAMPYVLTPLRAVGVHPILDGWMHDSLGIGKRVELLVTFRDTVAIPHFPEPDTRRARSDPFNVAALALAQVRIDTIQAHRDSLYRSDSTRIAHFGAAVLEKFWLVHAMRVTIPVDSVASLKTWNRVVYVQPRLGGEGAPSGPNSNPGDDVSAARAKIGSDALFAKGDGFGWIALLDTGVRPLHKLLTDPTHIGLRTDCVHLPPATATPDDECSGHGTASAAILTANSNIAGVTGLVDAYRGLTTATVNSYKVYARKAGTPVGVCSMELDAVAALRGFQYAVANLNRLIVAEVQNSTDDTGPLAQAADNAFRAGVAVIAADGNFGTGKVSAPANARGAIGVGDVDLVHDVQMLGQGTGPTFDRRVKPDVQAPTNVETARNGSDTDLLPFGDTSGATPLAAGCATLLRNWLGNGGGIDPGQIYAELILSGRKNPPFTSTPSPALLPSTPLGAGMLLLPQPTTAGVANGGADWIGKTAIAQGSSWEFPIDVPAGDRALEVAVWWPEPLVIDSFGNRVSTHNNIDLVLVPPTTLYTGPTTSAQSDGVFERLSAPYPTSGRWRLRVVGTNVPYASPQTVYWTASLRR